MYQVETNCFSYDLCPFEATAPSSFSEISIITAIPFDKEM